MVIASVCDEGAIVVVFNNISVVAKFVLVGWVIEPDIKRDVFTTNLPLLLVSSTITSPRRSICN